MESLPSAFFRGNSFFCAKWWFSKFDRRYKNADSSGDIRHTEKLLVPLESWIIGHFKTPLTFEIWPHIYWDIDDLASSRFFRSVFNSVQTQILYLLSFQVPWTKGSSKFMDMRWTEGSSKLMDISWVIENNQCYKRIIIQSKECSSFVI